MDNVSYFESDVGLIEGDVSIFAVRRSAAPFRRSLDEGRVNASRVDLPEPEPDVRGTTDVSTTRSLEIVDPACGSGSLLLGAHEELSRPLKVRGLAPVVAAEREALLAEHRSLAQKRFSEAGLTAVEAKRLAYVRWHLDRIEADELDERLGHLEKLAALSEQVAAQVENFRAQVVSLATPPGARRAEARRGKRQRFHRSR